MADVQKDEPVASVEESKEELPVKEEEKTTVEEIKTEIDAEVFKDKSAFFKNQVGDASQ